MPRPRRSLLKSAPRQSRSAETLRRLLDATEQLLATRHFEDLSVREILAAADVSTGSFYARFRTKEDLLPHLYQSYSDDLRGRLAAATDPVRWRGQSLAMRIQGFMSGAVRTYRERRGLLRAVALLARSRPQEIAPAAMIERDDQYRAAAALLLECRAEIRHSDPETAVSVGLLCVLATCRDKILFAEAPHPASVRVTDEQLTQELARVLYAYLAHAPLL